MSSEPSVGPGEKVVCKGDQDSEEGVESHLNWDHQVVQSTALSEGSFEMEQCDPLKQNARGDVHRAAGVAVSERVRSSMD